MGLMVRDLQLNLLLERLVMNSDPFQRHHLLPPICALSFFHP